MPRTGASGLARTLPVIGLVAFLAAPGAHARPAYARQTGLACGVCHINPEGGGPRTAFGRAFARNRHRLAGRPRPRQRSGDDSVFDGRRHWMGDQMMGPGMTGGDEP
jgi:hypothetical protein